MTLLLFDIDGTLLTTQGVGRGAVTDALSDLCGHAITTEGVTFSGKTDPQIMREVLAANECAGEDGALVDEALGAYAAVMEARLRPEHVTVLPGVADLLARLATEEAVQLALLTGNIERTGYLKLRAAGLDAYFPFGAFGSDHADRYQLPPLALQAAEAHTQRTFSGSETVIIGDTEHDICCGRAVGARAVAVCTGRYDRDDLAAHAPDVLLDDLSDADLFYERVLGVAA